MSWNIPIVSLDKVYFQDYEFESSLNKNYFLDCTRIEGSKQLISRNNYNNINNVEIQIQEISNLLKQNGRREIILVDDVVFSGNVLKSIIEIFKENGIKVVGIRACISTEESYEKFNQFLPKGIKCGCLLGKDVIDQICERDFYFGIVQSGISVFDNKGKICKAPYFMPFGNPVRRASIPKVDEKFFSNGCLVRSMYLWDLIEKNTGKKIYIKDLPEKIINTNEEDRIIEVLKKGLIYDEKDTNRDNGICR